jgi:uroporphyrinogen-III synthase
MAPLTGVGVLVTRPQAQAAELTHLLANAGARVLHLPTLETRERPDRAALRAALGPIDRYHWIIFISANAVRHGVSLLGERRDLPLAAVGPATASALRAAHQTATLVATAGFTSEHLLAKPELDEVAGKRILIVRGIGGRDVLSLTLRQRGAEVTIAEVYERTLARPPPGAVAAVERDWAAGLIDAVTATSGDVLRGLIELLTPDGRSYLQRAPLLHCRGGAANGSGGRADPCRITGVARVGRGVTRLATQPQRLATQCQAVGRSW